MIRYDLEKTVPSQFRRDLCDGICLLSHYIGKVNAKDEGGQIRSVEIELKPGADLSEDRLRVLVQNVAKNVELSSRKITHETLFEQKIDGLSKHDPHPALLESRDLRPATPGQFVVQGELARFFERMEETFRSSYEAMGCQNQQYPILVDIKPLFDLNYFQTMGHHIFYPVSVKGDYETIESFTKRNSRQANTERKLVVRPEEAGEIRNIVSPTVCYHCFQSLRGQKLAKNELAFTGMNVCVREERSTVTGLERLQCFHMREAIFIGAPEAMNERFQKCLSWAQEVFGKHFALQFRIQSANDPFFGTIGSHNQIFQSAFKLKYELQVYLPYADRWLACGSVNNHMSTMADSFGFGVEGHDKVSSICLAVGYERLALAMMAQKGMSPKEVAETFFKKGVRLGSN